VHAGSTENSEYYYVRSPNGLQWTYHLLSQFLPDGIDRQGRGIDSMLNIIWSDRSKNTTNYEIDTQSSFNDCAEGKSYVNAIKQPISIQNDLKISGKNNLGDPIYTLKDPNHPILMGVKDNLKKLFDESNNSHTLVNSYANVTADQKSVIFWIDPFGRLLRFINRGAIGVCGG
jgi:hypothetical protein